MSLHYFTAVFYLSVQEHPIVIQHRTHVSLRLSCRACYLPPNKRSTWTTPVRTVVSALFHTRKSMKRFIFFPNRRTDGLCFHHFLKCCYFVARLQILLKAPVVIFFIEFEKHSRCFNSEENTDTVYSRNVEWSPVRRQLWTVILNVSETKGLFHEELTNDVTWWNTTVEDLMTNTLPATPNQ